MPVFTEREHRDHDARPSLDDALGRLPVVCTIDKLRVRYLGPLVDLGHDRWLGELSQGAWGYLEECGWQETLDEGGAMLDGNGRVRRQWADAFGSAARSLARAGEHAGPEGNPERWASWLAFTLKAPRAYARARAEAKGCDR